METIPESKPKSVHSQALILILGRVASFTLTFFIPIFLPAASHRPNTEPSNRFF